MTKLITILILTCATAFAQSVSVRGTSAGAVHATGAGSVRGVATPYVPPASSNYCGGRFTIFDANTNVVIDNDSGITWTRDASIGAALGPWDDAMTYVANLTNGTYSDWEMPSIDEFSRNIASGSTDGLVDYPSTNGPGDPALPTGHPFTSVELGNYWSSTESGSDAWRLLLNDGSVSTYTKVSGNYIWPCRGP